MKLKTKRKMYKVNRFFFLLFIRLSFSHWNISNPPAFMFFAKVFSWEKVIIIMMTTIITKVIHKTCLYFRSVSARIWNVFKNVIFMLSPQRDRVVARGTSVHNMARTQRVYDTAVCLCVCACVWLMMMKRKDANKNVYGRDLHPWQLARSNPFWISRRRAYGLRFLG